MRHHPGQRTCSGKLIMKVPLAFIERVYAQTGLPDIEGVKVVLEAEDRWRSISQTAVVPAAWLPWNRPQKRI